MPLLLAGLALLDLGCLARWRQTDSHICDLQDGQWCENAQERRNRVCHNGIESESVKRQYHHGVHVSVQARNIVFERLDRRRSTGFWLRGSGCVDGDFAGHVCDNEGGKERADQGIRRRWRVYLAGTILQKNTKER
jgi:hypothetical protein